MRTLIIGGSGFVSGALARRALEHGHEVWTLTRGRRPAPPGCTALVADRTDPAAFGAALRSAGADWDLAVDAICYHPPEMQAVLEVLPGKARHLVFVSTDFVYDPARRLFPQPTDSRHYTSAAGYGADKRACERLLIERAPADLAWTIFRPNHIYGPGSQLGCLPAHARDAELLRRIRAEVPLRLVDGGHFLQMPVFAEDVADLALSAAGNAAAAGRVFHAPGPELIESRRYYELIAELVGRPLTIESLPQDAYRREHPDKAPFLCHRIYDLAPLAAAGLAVPHTPLREGLACQIAWLDAQPAASAAAAS